MSEELPYRCEYAKSGRAGCKKCKDPIEKESLRLAVMVRSPFFDGRTANWFHYDCFFAKHRPKGPDEFASFENMRFEDQKRIEKSIEEAKNGPPPENGKGKGSKKRKSEVIRGTEDFNVEYAKSNRAACKLCENKIEKEEIRISKKDYESENARRYGPLDRWFHVDCFVTARDELEFYWAADALPSFDKLKKNDQKALLKKIPTKEAKAQKVAKIEAVDKVKVESSAKEEKQLKKQSDLLYKYIENLKTLRKNELIELFEFNNIKTIPSDNTKRIEFMADALAFGLPQECPTCGDCLRFKISRYICMGNVSEWEKCSYTTEDPKRKAVKIADELKEYDFLKNYKFKAKKRIFNANLKASLATRTNNELALLTGVKAEGDTTDSAVVSTKLLSGYKVAILGKVPCKPKIEEFGGTAVAKVDSSVLFVVSDQDTFKKTKSKNLKIAEDYSIPIVSVDIFDAFLNNIGEENVIAKALVKSEIALWSKSEEDLQERVSNLNVNLKIKNTFKSGATSGKSGKSQLTKSKVVVKSGAIVDPDSELEDRAHILKDGSSFYNAILNLVDVTTNKNSYYKIQLLEDDRLNGKYWVFKSWGRIGTEIGRNKLENFHNKQAAIEEFKATYFDRTANQWDDRKNFQKRPNSYFPVEVDYGEYESKIDFQISKSTLPEPVKNLISLIFDVTRMKQTMLEFELDLEKMPLGKLSKNQLLEACSTLKEISVIVDAKQVGVNTSKLTAACNKFYSLVPHSFGTARPPLITEPEVISKKMEMLESLMDIELAYEIIKNVTADEDPIDFHYRKLNAVIEPVDRSGDEFKLVEQYMKNTHAKTHSTYNLELVNLFKVQRSGEEIRFSKHEDNPNRMLLWHGSRLTNFVGILSQGLRIAPPEAPVCGYMFGKGVYFADSVSKSANYCNVHSGADTGLLLLSEVALGQSYELTQSNYITKLDKGYSSVKGVGSTHPDPKKVHVLPNGVKVPYGKMTKNKDVGHTSLLYNEYIVYNEEQIKIRYLVNVKFNFNSLF